MMILIKISGSKAARFNGILSKFCQDSEDVPSWPGPGVAGGCVQGVLLLLTGPSPHTPVRLFKGSHIASFRQ